MNLQGLFKKKPNLKNRENGNTISPDLSLSKYSHVLCIPCSQHLFSSLLEQQFCDGCLVGISRKSPLLPLNLCYVIHDHHYYLQIRQLHSLLNFIYNL